MMSFMNKTFVITVVVALTPVSVKADPRPPAGPRLREIVAENYPNGQVDMVDYAIFSRYWLMKQQP